MAKQDTGASVEQQEVVQEANPITYTQAQFDEVLKKVSDRDSKIIALETKLTEKDNEIEGLQSTVETLNELLKESEKPSFEALQIKLKPLGLNVIRHRGEIKKSTIGSLEGVPIHDLSDEKLDELEELGIVSEIEE